MLERERIAGELHDTLLQGYLSASLHVHAGFGVYAHQGDQSDPDADAYVVAGQIQETDGTDGGKRNRQKDDHRLGERTRARVQQQQDNPQGEWHNLSVVRRCFTRSMASYWPLHEMAYPAGTLTWSRSKERASVT